MTHFLNNTTDDRFMIPLTIIVIRLECAEVESQAGDRDNRQHNNEGRCYEDDRKRFNAFRALRRIR